MFGTDTQQCSHKKVENSAVKMSYFSRRWSFFTMEQYYQFLSAPLSEINGLLIKTAVSLKNCFATKLDNSSVSIRCRYKRENRLS